MRTRAFFLAGLLGTAWLSAQAALPVDKIQLPPGFRIEVVTDQVPDARAMAWGDKGTLFVGSRGAGKVYALTLDGGKVAKIRTVASGLSMPVGVTFRDGALYVSAVSRILRLDRIEERLDDPPKPVVVTDRFPTETSHGWKFIAFGPDGWLYVPVGAPCNICERDGDRYYNIQRIAADGSKAEVFAKGVRNTVGFDWDPRTKALWFTENGRDMMGDELPNDELNYAPKAGLNFGYPYCHQGDTPDPEYGKKQPCSAFVPPVAKLGPHVAALGMRFYTGQQFPAEYRHNVFIAEHGSWNRSAKIGYRIKRVAVGADGKLLKQEVFAQGWLDDGRAWGRPVDVLNAPDGSLLVSDDHAGAIYRIRYVGTEGKR
jgi:glucose/arabinose dehydrogenase